MRCALAALAVSGMLVSAGCQGGPSRVPMPSVDSDGIASRAMEMYDKDGDGFLSSEELDASPPLKSAINQIDTDGDGKMSQDEIIARVEFWKKKRTAIYTIPFEVRFRGQPLPGAVVELDPDPIMGEEWPSAQGETNEMGSVVPTLPDDQLPADLAEQGIHGRYAGFYYVRVTKDVNGKQVLAEKFNTESQLGQEMGPAAEGTREGNIRVFLK